MSECCECCGIEASLIGYGEADQAGHIWTHYVCGACHGHCTSDEDGNPVHMSREWDGTPETFESCKELIPDHAPPPLSEESRRRYQAKY